MHLPIVQELKENLVRPSTDAAVSNKFKQWGCWLPSVPAGQHAEKGAERRINLAQRRFQLKDLFPACFGKEGSVRFQKQISSGWFSWAFSVCRLSKVVSGNTWQFWHLLSSYNSYNPNMTPDVITALLNMNYWYLRIKERHINDGIIWADCKQIWLPSG